MVVVVTLVSGVSDTSGDEKRLSLHAPFYPGMEGAMSQALTLARDSTVLLWSSSENELRPLGLAFSRLRGYRVVEVRWGNSTSQAARLEWPLFTVDTTGNDRGEKYALELLRRYYPDCIIIGMGVEAGLKERSRHSPDLQTFFRNTPLYRQGSDGSEKFQLPDCLMLQIASEVASSGTTSGIGDGRCVLSRIRAARDQPAMRLRPVLPKDVSGAILNFLDQAAALAATDPRQHATRLSILTALHQRLDSLQRLAAGTRSSSAFLDTWVEDKTFLMGELALHHGGCVASATSIRPSASGYLQVEARISCFGGWHPSQPLLEALIPNGWALQPAATREVSQDKPLTVGVAATSITLHPPKSDQTYLFPGECELPMRLRSELRSSHNLPIPLAVVRCISPPEWKAAPWVQREVAIDSLP